MTTKIFIRGGLLFLAFFVFSYNVPHAKAQSAGSCCGPNISGYYGVIVSNGSNEMCVASPAYPACTPPSSPTPRSGTNWCGGGVRGYFNVIPNQWVDIQAQYIQHGCNLGSLTGFIDGIVGDIYKQPAGNQTTVPSSGTNFGCMVGLMNSNGCPSQLYTTGYTVSVSKSGSGAGTISGSAAYGWYSGHVPGGTINCGGVCSTVILKGFPVALTATPGANSTFAGWGGACSGTSPTCTVTVNANTSVSAIFNLPSPTITKVNPVNNQPGGTLTITGTNFTTTGNTVNLLTSAGSVVSVQTNIQSSNGTAVLFTLPTNINAGAYDVQVSNSNGTSGTFAISIYSMLSPSDLVATMGVLLNTGQVDLDWTDNSSNETGFQIERSTDADNGNMGSFRLLSTTPANATSYTDDLSLSAFNFSKETYRVRATFADNSFSDYSNVASTSNCVAVSGNGPRKIIFMIGDGVHASMDDYMAVVNMIIGGFNSVDPFKTYSNYFSFYFDLKKQDQSAFRLDPTNSQFYATSTDVAIKSTSSCGNDGLEYIFLFHNPAIYYGYTSTDWADTRDIGNVVYLDVPALVDGGKDVPTVAIHESGHAIGKLDDEYIHVLSGVGPKEPFDTYKLLDTYNDPLENCVNNPYLDYWNEALDLSYASTTIRNCGYASTPQGDVYYRPSTISIMNDDIVSQKFNVISCGYVVSGILGEPVDKIHAERHWPGADQENNTDPGCLSMDTDKVDIPPLDPITPSITSISASVVAPGSTLAISAGVTDETPLPAKGNIFDKVNYYLEEFAKQMIAAVAGASSSVTGSGFTPTGDAVKIYNSTTSTDIVGLTSSGNTLTFTVPANLPPGQYSLKVGAFNSGWSNSVPITVTTAPINQTPSITLTTSSYFIAYGGRATLTWTPTSVTNCIASGGTGNADDNWNGAKTSSNGSYSQSTGILTNATAYTISCTGSGGNIAASVQIYVTGHPPTPTITSFTASPTSVTSGGNVTLSWTATNASLCWGAGMGPAKTFPISYSVIRNPLTTTTYTLTCVDTSGNSSTPANVKVTIIPTKIPSVPATTASVPAITIPSSSVPPVQTYTTPTASPTVKSSPTPIPSPTPTPTPTSTSKPSPTPVASTLNMTSAIWDAIQAIGRYFAGQ